MRILKAIYFINSANIPYAEIRLDGNVHIAGVNGVGKSTILRAIVFFYNADTKKLGIEPEQRPFSEFYLRYVNSYIVYEIIKENEVYLVLVFRYQNRAGFRFVKTPFAKELFIDEHNRAKFPREVVQTLNAQKLFYSPIIERHKEFREIIYGIPSKVKTRPFSLFESKSYANIPRTISNIFLNYKLESEFIKKSIIYSLVEPDDKRYQINLSAIREPLEKIDGYLRDIDLYTNNEQTAKDIARQYEWILTIEADKRNMAVQLGGSVKFAAVEKKDVEEKIEFLNAEIAKLQDLLNELDRQFTNKRDTLIGQISILKDKLKEAKKKQAHYQSIHIDDILEKVAQKAFHEKSLEALQQQKALLLKKAQHIANAFNSQIAQLEQDQRELVFNIDQEKLQAEKTVEQEKRAIEQQYQRKIREKEHFYQQKLHSLENRLEQIKETIRELQLHKKDVQHSHPFQKEIQDFEVQVQEIKGTLHKHEVTIKEKKGRIEVAQKEIEHQQREGEGKIEQCKGHYQRQRHDKENSLNSVNRKLHIDKNSFLAFLETSCPDYKETIAKVCREDMFLMADLSPEIVDTEQSTLFGVTVDLENLDRVIHEREEYEQQKQQLEQEIQQLDEQYKTSLSEIRLEVDAFIEEQQKVIGKQYKAISRMEQEDREKTFHLQKCQHQITVLKEKEEEQKRQEIEKIDAELLDEREKQNKIDQEIKRHQTKKLQEIEAFETEKNQRMAATEGELKKQIDQFSQQQRTIKDEYHHRIAELEEEKKKALQNEGVDIQKVEAIENQIKTLKKALEFIKKHEPTAIEYQKDKREHIDRIPEFERQNAELARKEKEFSRQYEMSKGKLLTQKQQKESALRAKQTRVQELQRDLKEFDEFKLSPLYAELKEQIEESFAETRESISRLIRQLDLKDQKFQRKRNDLIDNMTEFSGKFRLDNIFNFQFSSSGSREQSFREFAQDLKVFVEERKIETFKREVNEHYGQVMRNLSKEFNDLNSKAGDIQKAINKINNDFERSNFVGAIKKIQLRFRESDNRTVNTLKHIAEFVSENPFAGEELGLFSQQSHTNPNKDHKAIELLNRLRKNIEDASKQQVISLEDSFKLEFKVIENDNDSGFVEKLSHAGSTGTDILVKAMIYITLLDVAKEKFSKRAKEHKIHCIIDEVGKLDGNYLKQLIAFANNKNILLINGSPNILDPLAYNTSYRVLKDDGNNSIVKKLLAERQ